MEGCGIGDLKRAGSLSGEGEIGRIRGGILIGARPFCERRGVLAREQ